MEHGAEQHIEHAEHAVHAAGDDFNRPVTMSIAIVAAVLACVSMLGHRAHNETLRLQGDALTLRTDASILSTKGANKWAYYQNKNLNVRQAKIALGTLGVISDPSKYDEVAKVHKDYIAKYTGKKEGKGSEAKEKLEGRLAELTEEAEKIDKDAEKLIEQAKEKLEESHLEHGRGARFDYAELGLQFGVVLCSLAILTRGKYFWYVGLISSAIGTVVAVTGQFGLFLGGH